MPPEIVWRRKRGMGVSLTQWCLQDFWRDLVDWLNPGIRRYWQPDLAARLAKE
jgi:asparagine synthase (glutamine-hydrolysing)